MLYNLGKTLKSFLFLIVKNLLMEKNFNATVDSNGNGKTLEESKKKLPDNNNVTTKEVQDMENKSEKISKAEFLKNIKDAYLKSCKNVERGAVQLVKWHEKFLEEAKEREIAEDYLVDFEIEFLSRNKKIQKIVKEMENKENGEEEVEETKLDQAQESVVTAKTEDATESKIEKINPKKIRKVSDQKDGFKDILISKKGFKEDGKFIIGPRPNDKDNDNIYEIKEDGSKVFAGKKEKPKKKPKPELEPKPKIIATPEKEITQDEIDEVLKGDRGETESGEFTEIEDKAIQELYFNFVQNYKIALEGHFSVDNGYDAEDSATVIGIEMKKFWKKVLPGEVRNDKIISSEKIEIAIEKVKEITQNNEIKN